MIKNENANRQLRWLVFFCTKSQQEQRILYIERHFYERW